MIPHQMAEQFSRMPQQNMGILYARLKIPFLPFTIWREVKAWGQLCDGRSHKSLVHLMLYNYFPWHGKGWTFVGWKAKPDNPSMCKSQLYGVVECPQPFNGCV